MLVLVVGICDVSYNWQTGLVVVPPVTLPVARLIFLVAGFYIYPRIICCWVLPIPLCSQVEGN